MELVPMGIPTWEPACIALPPLPSERFSDLIPSRLGDAIATQVAAAIAGQMPPGVCFHKSSPLRNTPMYIALAWVGESGAQSKILTHSHVIAQAANLHTHTATTSFANRAVQVSFSPGVSLVVPDLFAMFTASVPALWLGRHDAMGGNKKRKQGRMVPLMNVVRRHRPGTVGAGVGGEGNDEETPPTAALTTAVVQMLRQLDLRCVGSSVITQAPAHVEWSIALAACLGEQSAQVERRSVALRGCSRMKSLTRHIPWPTAVEKMGPAAHPAKLFVWPWEPNICKNELLEGTVITHHLSLSSKKMVAAATSSVMLTRTACGRPLLPVEAGWPHLLRPLPPPSDLPTELSTLRVGEGAVTDPRQQALVGAVRGFVRAAVKEVLGKTVSRDDRRLEAEGLLPLHVPQLIGILQKHLGTLGISHVPLPATLAADYPTVVAIADLIAGSFSLGGTNGESTPTTLSKDVQKGKTVRKGSHLIRPKRDTHATTYVASWPEDTHRFRWHAPYALRVCGR